MSDRGTWHFVDEDGKFTGRTFRGRASELDANTPRRCTAVEGDPPALKRLAPSTEPRTKESQIPPRQFALLKIRQLERRQDRSLREAFLNPGDAAARKRVKDLDDEITALRAVIAEADQPEAPHGPRPRP